MVNVFKNSDDQPFIPADQSLPEITFKGTLLAIVLTIILAAANAFLGLKVGLTISASIPAAVVSMGALRFFRNSNILENNIVQTCASAGEAIAAGMIFIVPALIIMHYWTDFNYWMTVSVGAVGGMLGVLFSIPLRKLLLAEKTLRFPEGVAIASVLKASASSGADLRLLVSGGIVGGVIELFQDGFHVLAGGLQYWRVTASAVWGGGIGFSPALLAAGYIIGINVACAILLGIILGWLGGVPLLSYLYHLHDPSIGGQAIAHDLWAHNIRYVGVGCMILGGIWMMCHLTKPVYKAMKALFDGVQQVKMDGILTPRTERDVPLNYALWLLLLIGVAGFVLILVIIDPSFGCTPFMRYTLAAVGTLYLLFMGFVLATLAGYFAGLVGSTNAPGSSMMIAGLLTLCLVMVLLFNFMPGFTELARPMDRAVIAIMITSILASVIMISADTFQDLKAGQLVGSTPWKQQAMLILGALVASLVVPLILQLLFHAYGIGGVFPRPNMNPDQMLAAPQAGLMTAIAQGVFHGDLPWLMIFTGMVIGVIGVIFDEWAKATNRWRFPVLGIGIGIYLPLEATVPVVIGGVLSFMTQRTLLAAKHSKKMTLEAVVNNQHKGILQACGIVAGAALMGVILAIPFAIKQNADALALVSTSYFEPIAVILSLITTSVLVYWMYRVVTRPHKVFLS